MRKRVDNDIYLYYCGLSKMFESFSLSPPPRRRVYGVAQKQKLTVATPDGRRPTATRCHRCRAKKVPRARRPNTKAAATVRDIANSTAKTMIIKIIACGLLLIIIIINNTFKMSQCVPLYIIFLWYVQCNKRLCE